MAVLIAAVVVGAAACAPSFLEAGEAALSTRPAHDPGRCVVGLDRVADRWLTVYDREPTPRWFFPLVSARVRMVGVVAPGDSFTICARLDRSTWNTRSAWFRIRRSYVSRAGPAVLDGWINLPLGLADTWACCTARRLRPRVPGLSGSWADGALPRSRRAQRSYFTS